MFGDSDDEDIVMIGAGPVEFRSDGTFSQVFNGRIRSVLRGYYIVYHDWVCLYAGERQDCFALFRSADRRYLRVDPRPNVVASRVHFEPLPPA